MGKRKGRLTETLNHRNDGEEDESRIERSDELEEAGFFACYLLTSLCPRYKGHTYIGFTVNPRRRIRQHNGEICSGAWRTKKKRPWEMVFCIYGFPTNVAALQFEWAWQHPVESLAVRKAAVGFKSLGGLANKIKLAYTMLTLPAWNNLNLNVNFFSTKYTKHYAGCPTLPNHMKVHIRSMDELPCYTEEYKEYEDDDIFRFENNSWDDDEEPERTSPSNTEARFEDTTLPDLEIHVSDIENTTHVSDIENATHVLENTTHVSDTEYTTHVSDIENDERPYNNSPVWLVSDTPDRSFKDYCSDVVSPLKEGQICNLEVVTENCSEMASTSGQVEVIDLFTPSPKYKKKRGVFVTCPEIIDLTESPVCV